MCIYIWACTLHVCCRFKVISSKSFKQSSEPVKKMCMQIDQCAQLLSQAAKPKSFSLGQGKGVNLTPAESEWDFS